MSRLVETHAGHRLHERPLRFQSRGGWRRVDQVLFSWQEPGVLRFTVLADDGQKYSLEYNQEKDIWKVALAAPR